MTDKNSIKQMLSIVRKTVASSIANDIASVQPINVNYSKTFTMNVEMPFRKKYYLEASWKQGDDGYHLVNVSSEVEEWILSQPIEMWEREHDEHSNDAFKKLYTINDELMTWMTLRWG